MSWPIGIAAYLVIWWVVIFVVLPFGIHPAAEGELGHDPGAPANPRIKLKAAITTAVAAVIWLLFYWAVTHGLMSFR
jgi:predicted secreted protein